MDQLIVNARFLTQKATGVQRFAIELSLHLKKNFTKIIFVSPYNIINEQVANVLNAVTYGKTIGHIWEQIELPIFCSKYKNALLLNLCNTAPLLYSKKIVCIHDLGFIHHPEWFNKKFSLLYNFIIPRIVKNSLKILTVSEYSKLDIIKEFDIDPNKIMVIYNGVSHIFLQQINEESNTNLSAVSKKREGVPYILAVSSLDPRKNFPALMQAFLNVNNQSIKLLIVGGEYKSFPGFELDKNLIENKSIEFVGYVTDEKLKELYQNALFFVYPSLFEGFGIPPLEAMASGCPTLVSDIPSIREVCGEASLYINPLIIESITQGMTRLINDPELQRKLISKGINRYKLFRWEDSAYKLINLIKSM